MNINLVGAFIRNAPFGTEIAFKKGLERLGGHKITCLDTSYPNQSFDMDADVTIVFKWMEGYWNDLSNCGGNKIVYQPDDIRFPHIMDMMRKMNKYCDFALTYDDEAAKIAGGIGYKKSQRLLLTADPELYRNIPNTEKDIDVCFVGSLTGGHNHRSRAHMCHLATAIGLKTKFATDIYDIEEIVNIYNRSKIVLNHATDVGQSFGSGYGYQCRHFEAGFTKACVLSNAVIDDDRSVKNFPTFSDEKDFLLMTRKLLSNDDLRSSFASDLYDELNSKHRPEHRAADIIDFIGTL